MHKPLIGILLFHVCFSSEERFYDWEQLGTGNHITSSEVGDKTVVTECGNAVVNKLRTIALERLLTIATPRDLDVYIPSHHNIELNQLKNDISFLMVGIESHSFPYSGENNSFLPRKGLSADGLTPEALESFSTPFMTSGNLVRKLTILTETSSGRGAIYDGFVYGVKSFLRLYQNLVSTLVKSQNGGRFFQLARQLMKHVLFVSKLCNLDQSNGIPENYFAVPKGMELLLYVLSQTRHVSQTDLELLSISILRATINPYLKFLSSWLFHGTCRQSDIEFGIQINERFLSVQDRGFWVNAYTSLFDYSSPSSHHVQRPLDINYMTTKVVACGKALNLLRMCNPSHPLCTYGIKFRSKLEIVVTPSQERHLRISCLEYMNDMTEKMKQNHAENELLKAAEADKKDNERSPQPIPVVNASKVVLSPKEKRIELVPVEYNPLDGQERKDILVEKDETERIKAIRKDLTTYYNGSENQPKLYSAELDAIKSYDKVCSDEKKDPESLRNEENAHSPGQEKLSDGEKQSNLNKKLNRPDVMLGDKLLPSKNLDMILAVKDIGSKKDKRSTAKSIISLQDPKTHIVKSLHSTKTVDECILTVDAEVLKYSVDSFVAKPTILQGIIKPPPSTKGLAPLELLVKNSIHIPLMTQLTLVNKEILHFFLVDQNLFKNLEAICNYLLLKDNEFAFNLGYGLSDAMEEDTLILQKHPTSLSRILKNAIHTSSAASVDPLASNIGFSVNQIINGQDQHCSDVMDMLRLSYSVTWPLNIIITPDMIDSYGLIFQLLLRMENVSITLNKTFMNLKQHRYLSKDFKFVQLQVIRHRMLNYITIIKTYIRNQIVVACWQEFQNDLKHNVSCLDTLWNAHSKYINKLLSRAFLYKETQPVKNILLKTLDTVTTFTLILQHKDLICIENEETSINSELFEEIKITYKTFHHLLNLFTSIVSKLETKGFKYHLQELLACLKIASACGTASKI